MANVISLHKRQLFLPTGVVAEYGTLEVFESGTTTQVSVYADEDLLTERSQPIAADVNGVLPVCYVADATALRLLAKDEDGNALPGYPQDSILPESTGGSAADEISATPFEGVTGTTVQAQLEEIYAEASSNDDLVTGRFTPWTTGGSSNAFTLTPSPAATTYAAGQSWMVRPDRANTGAATLNVSGLGARNVMKYNTSGVLVVVAAGEIETGREFLAYDDGTQIIMLLGRDFPVKTSNANGTSTRFADGTQICRIGRLTLTTASAADHVAATWTYPQAFANTTDLVVQPVLVPENYSDAGTTFADSATGVSDRANIGPPVPGAVGLTTAAIRVFSTVDFAISDELFVGITAIGNWR